MSGQGADRNDEKNAVSRLLDPPGSFICGDRVGSSHITLPVLSPTRRILLGMMGGALALALLVTVWPEKPFAWGSRPAITTLSRVKVPSAHIHTLSDTLSEVFEVYPPVLAVTPKGDLEITDGSSNASVAVIPSTKPTCQSTLVQHSFANSYGQPYVGDYSPPPCDFNRVTFNLTVQAAGRQYDRLGSISFGDIELFRTSTAEPTKNGITWTYLKDMTSFLPLFRAQQKIIFDLGNLVNDIYTSPFNVTLTAAFFTVQDGPTPADVIIPISKRQGATGQASFFKFPQDKAINAITLPQNTRKAVFTIAATGQAQEEFWWGNVPQSETNVFPGNDSLAGFSPFREVQLYIDDLLAGVAWPFPVIFTGGVVPGLWRPVVGIDAFDLKEEEIDITPWLGLLCDGKSHTFELRVSGFNDSSDGTAYASNTTGTTWWLSGKVFTWLDRPGHVTTSGQLKRLAPDPSFKIASQVYHSSNGSNLTLTYEVEASRHLSVSSQIQLSDGSVTVAWTQQLQYSNSGNYTSTGDQTNTARTTGQYRSSGGYYRTFEYPIYSHSTQQSIDGNLTLTATVNRSKNMQTIGRLAFPIGIEPYAAVNASQAEFTAFQGAALRTSQNGSAYYTANQTEHTSYGYGNTTQHMSLFGVRSSEDSDSDGMPKITHTKELFHRQVLAVNDSVVQDEESLMGVSIGHRHGHRHHTAGDGEGMALSGTPGKGAWVRGW
ncbi:Peptide-N4-(N-acetyl-beta-glucosaminyl)asparagine amidase A [Cercospora beticola]|uniref:Peptide-N4-(N-acetyl-beta-glucosaminyl)asparagine amidase A n=1 Tax=Cercospora beticola TaxID=122368 RepID=A0A2G5HJ57_CERBT|nr:Peptide-N4-(N-acetyl-beta-glucosaminyl)asparagine amidase A [Cercospora beticola]PIA92569.1 Peptide-N4-(N-acetyl-beta-glucosaminyl)asparagine amidase A [Cercospora beticola]WPB01793.1 hypothetical protein RHO25_006425 [Cercospora beticola]